MIGGKTQFNVLMKLLAGVSGEYDELHDQLVNSNGALDEMSTIMKDNLGGSIEGMKSAIEGALIKAFEAMEPVLQTVVDLITEAANWFSSLDEEQQKTIVTIAAVVACIGPLLMAVGQLIIVGGNAVTLFGSFAGGATAAGTAATGLGGAIGVLAGPVALGALAIALVGIMAYIGDSSNSILFLQEKFGGLGYVIGAVCEFISGVVQLTFGNLGIAIMGICDIIAAILDGPGGQTVGDAWDRMNANLEINTNEAMGKIVNTTSRGLSQMRTMNETELGTLVSTTQTMLNQLPAIAAGNYSEAATKMSHHLQVMDSNQLLALTGMNDTTKMLFQGIKSSMTVEEKVNEVTFNLKRMQEAGKIDIETMEKDITTAMGTIKDQITDKTKESADNADLNTKTLAANVATNTLQAKTDANTNTVALADSINLNTLKAQTDGTANTNVLANNINTNTLKALNDSNTNTSTLATNVDTNTKTAATKADVNTKDLASKTDINTKDAATKTDVNTKTLATKTDTNTKTAATNADNATKTLASNVDKNTKTASDKADTNTKALGTKIDTNTKNAGTTTDTNTKDLTSKIDINTKDATTKADTNTKDMADKVGKNASDMNTLASNQASFMKTNVTISTRDMADAAIANWERIRTAYEKSISGNVNITKTTTNVVRAESAPARAAAREIERISNIQMPRVNIDDYQIRGGFFNSKSVATVKLKENNINLMNNSNNKALEQKLDILIKLMAESAKGSVFNITTPVAEKPSEIIKKAKKLERDRAYGF